MHVLLARDVWIFGRGGYQSQQASSWSTGWKIKIWKSVEYKNRSPQRLHCYLAGLNDYICQLPCSQSLSSCSIMSWAPMLSSLQVLSGHHSATQYGRRAENSIEQSIGEQWNSRAGRKCMANAIRALGFQEAMRQQGSSLESNIHYYTGTAF